MTVCGLRCHATTEQLTTIGLGVWFELQVSVRYSASHYTLHCLLLCPFPDNVPVLTLVSPRKLWTSLFSQKVDSWIFSSLVTPDVSIPWTGAYSPVHNDALSPYWAAILRWISAPVTPSDHRKTDHATLFFLRAHGEWRSHFNCVTAQS